MGRRLRARELPVRLRSTNRVLATPVSTTVPSPVRTGKDFKRDNPTFSLVPAEYGVGILDVVSLLRGEEGI